VTGLPPKGYLDMLRMEASVQRLISTDCSIREIGAASGFPEQSHFSRFFAQQVGVTPAQYRRASCR
jgi:AraC family transcriptional regulator